MIRLPQVTAALAGAVFAVSMGSLPAQSASTLKVTTCQQKAHDHVEVFFKAFLDGRSFAAVADPVGAFAPPCGHRHGFFPCRKL